LLKSGVKIYLTSFEEVVTVKEDQGTNSNQQKQQGGAVETAAKAKAPTGKEGAKRKSENQTKPNPGRQSRSLSAGQRR